MDTYPPSTLFTSPSRKPRLSYPLVTGRHTSADYARQTTIDAFGWRFARALDQADFRDRPPGEFPVPVPEASPL